MFSTLYIISIIYSFSFHIGARQCGSTCLILSVCTGAVPTVETFVLGGLLVVLLLITGVFGRLWLRSRRFYPAQEAQLTLSNIHHISEVAS